MIYLRKFDSHASYESELNVGGGVDISLPNVSYCKDVKDVHYLPYNLVRFYVSEITTETPHTVKIYTDNVNSVDVTVSEGNKWYTYLLPKDKLLYRISGDTVTKVTVKADINTSGTTIIPNSTVEASFKGSDTSKVTNMRNMFSLCKSITSLDLSSFNTSKVTSMEGMFWALNIINSLDVSSFDTSNVTNMYHMFGACSGLTSLDLSGFNTSKVTNMSGMFDGDDKLSEINLSSFDTSKVTNMMQMFNGCRNLTELNVSHFNFNNTNINRMFNGCSKLNFLDISGWDLNTVTIYDDLFKGCESLHMVKMVGCDTNTVNKIKEQLRVAGIPDSIVITHQD